MSALILGLLFVTIYNLSPGEIYYDPLYAGKLVGENGVSRGLLHPLKGLPSDWRTSKRLEKPHWLGNLRGPPTSDLGLLRAGLYLYIRLGAPKRPYFLITLGFPEGRVSAFSA